MAQTLNWQTPTPLVYFAALVADDEQIPLLEAAIAIAQDEMPQLDVLSVLHQVDSLSVTLKLRLPADAGTVQRLRALNHFFFNELGFAGNVNDFHDRRNSYLDQVLTRRLGIPITLAVLYIEFASQIGLKASGVAFPGHFLVRIKMQQGDVVVDPFDGRSLSRDELDERLSPMRASLGLSDDQELPLAPFLQGVQARTILARMLNNLKAIHRAAGDWPRLLAVSNRLVVLLPQSWEERRDRAHVHAQLRDFARAADDLEAYLQHCPRADDAPAQRVHLARYRQADATPGP